MRCWECRLEFDEINESQPVCPGCGQLPIPHRDHPEFSAVDEVGTVATLEEREAEDDGHFDTDSVAAAIPLPIDLREAPMTQKLCWRRQVWQVFTSRKDSDSSPSRPGG